MHILIYSHVFLPKYGGSGQVARMLAEALSSLGHQLTIVTETPGPAAFEQPAYRLHRGFSWVLFYDLAKQADAVLLVGMSLKALLPALAAGRRPVISHHMMAGQGWLNMLKRYATRLGKNVAVSRAVASSFGLPMAVISNPYDDSVYRLPRIERRERDFVFVGRVIDCKGLHILISAMSELRDRGRSTTLTVIGDGDALPAAQQQAMDLDLSSWVHFAGRLDGPSISSELQNHRAIVVPSLWEEPFGVVALEGMACGCTPIVAKSGGLPEAVGGFGMTYPRHDHRALADCLEQVLAFPVGGSLPPAATAFVARHEKLNVARLYLSSLRDDQASRDPTCSAA